jgi:hypothetical protein
MAKLSEEEVQEIIQREAPGTEVAPPPRSGAAVEPAADAGTPDLEHLQRKYGDAADAPAAERADDGHDPDADDEDDDDDVEIVSVRPKEAADPWDRGATPKSVVISTKTKRIIGKQG